MTMKASRASASSKPLRLEDLSQDQNASHPDPPINSVISTDLARTSCPIFKENEICGLLWYAVPAVSLAAT